MMTIRLSGYQGPLSVHTEGLLSLAKCLGASGINVEVTADVTQDGISAKSLFERVEHEDAHLCYMASSYLTSRVGSLAILDIPLSVVDRKRAHAALDGPTGLILAHDVAAATDLQILGFWDNGVRHISNRLKPLRSVRDCDGLVIRTLDNQIYQDTLSAFGFTPVVTDVRELAGVIASGAVDAQDNPLTNLLNFGIHHHHPFISLIGYMYGIALLVCRRSWLASIRPELAEVIANAARAATRAQRHAARGRDEAVLQELTKHGVQILDQDELDMDSFRLAAAPIVASAMARIDSDLIQAYFQHGEKSAS